MQNRVFVLNKHRQPLMPCSPRTARKLLEQGKATVAKKEPFTIRLKYGSTGYKQPVSHSRTIMKQNNDKQDAEVDTKGITGNKADVAKVNSIAGNHDDSSNDNKQTGVRRSQLRKTILMFFGSLIVILVFLGVFAGNRLLQAKNHRNYLQRQVNIEVFNRNHALEDLCSSASGLGVISPNANNTIIQTEKDLQTYNSYDSLNNQRGKNELGEKITQDEKMMLTLIQDSNHVKPDSVSQEVEEKASDVKRSQSRVDKLSGQLKQASDRYNRFKHVYSMSDLRWVWVLVLGLISLRYQWAR